MATRVVVYISETGNGGWEELPGVTCVPGLENIECYWGEFVSTEPDKFEEVWDRYAERHSCLAWFMYELREVLCKDEDGTNVRKKLPIVKFSARIWPTIVTRYASNQVDELRAKISIISDVHFSFEEDGET